MSAGKRLQKKIQKKLTYDVEDEWLNKLSFDFKIKLLREKKWIDVGKTEDGYNNIIYQCPTIKQYFVLIGFNSRSFCFTTNKNNAKCWFESEVIFETILSNI